MIQLLEKRQSNLALDIRNRQTITLPFYVEAELAGKDSPFYIIPAYLPYGLTRLPGSLIVCETYQGGVAIKSWKFKDDVNWAPVGWNTASIEGLISVHGDNQTWFPGEIEYDLGTTSVYEEVAGRKTIVHSFSEGFQTFMNRHYSTIS